MAKSKVSQKDTPRQETIQSRVKSVQSSLRDIEKGLNFIVRANYNTFNGDCHNIHTPDLIVSMVSEIVSHIKNQADELFLNLEIPEKP